MSGGGSAAGTRTVSTSSPSAAAAVSKARRESASHRSVSTAIQTARRPRDSAACLSRSARAARAALTGCSNPRAPPGVKESRAAKTRGARFPSRARAFSAIARRPGVRRNPPPDPRVRARAPAASREPSSGKSRNALESQNSARRYAASVARRRSNNPRAAGCSMRRLREKSLSRKPARIGAAAGPGPPRESDAGLLTSQSRGVPSAMSHTAPHRSSSSSQRPDAWRNDAAAHACRKRGAPQPVGMRPSRIRRPGTRARATRNVSSSREKSRGGARVACSSERNSSQRSFSPETEKRSTPSRESSRTGI